MPTPQEARARQTAYLATESWWKTRVEAIRDRVQRQADRAQGERLYELQGIANLLDALIVERSR